MSIEQQFEDALADFHALIAEGSETGAAVIEAARSNGIKADVFEKRLSRTMDLETLTAEIRRGADRERSRTIIHATVAQYVGEGIRWMNRREEVRAEMLDRVAIALGRQPTSEDAAQVDRSYQQIREERSIQFQREQFKLMRELLSRPDAEDR